MEKKRRFHYGGTLRIFGRDKAFGPGLTELLRKVEQTGSLQKAAVSMGMSYSKAWKILKTAEEEWGFPMTDRETGGRDGGGSRLTDEGKQVLARYEAFAEEAKEQLDRLFEKHFPEAWVDSLPCNKNHRNI